MNSAIDSFISDRRVWLVARIFLVVVFVSSGLAKLIDFDGGMDEMKGAGLFPEWLFNILTIVTLLGGSVLLVIDKVVWLGALILSVFLILTVVIVHSFWSLPEDQAMPSLYIALEHVSLIGGLMAASIASKLHRDLAALRG